MNKRKRYVADVAFKLFLEKGLQQTSIQDIIQEAKISKGTFYNYFPTKNDCIAEILEGLRYDAAQLRMEIQIGKDEKDRQVLINQISTIIQLSEERNINVLFEGILNSNETDLKKLVLKHRLHEAEWLANRFKDVYGDELNRHAFELSILFNGMLHYVIFLRRITNSKDKINQLVDVILSYVEVIIPKMVENNDNILSGSAIEYLRSKIDRKIITLEEILEIATYIEQNKTFSTEQADLFEAIKSELTRDRIRKSVIQPLLMPLRQAFETSPLKHEINDFVSSIWYFLKMN